MATDLVAIGSFRCPSTHRLYRDSGPAGSHLFVFPRTATFIRHRGADRRFLANANLVTLYNRGQEYERSRASDLDASDWYAVSAPLLLQAVSAYDPAIHDRPDRPFRFTHAPVSAALYAKQRRLFERASSGESSDGLQAEECVLGLLDDVIRGSYRAAAATVRSAPMRDKVEAARRLITANLARPLGLTILAQAVEASPFALCRAFQATTGMTVSAYRNGLRMHVALERLRGTDDLTTIALELGYCSHSHFTRVFQRTFGQSPSVYRQQR
jgi:AraC-like DNA-binding protein